MKNKLIYTILFLGSIGLMAACGEPAPTSSPVKKKASIVCYHEGQKIANVPSTEFKLLGNGVSFKENGKDRIILLGTCDIQEN